MIDSLLFCHLQILVGIFHYRTWLVYFNDGLSQNAIGLREQASWMHTHLVSFVGLSYIYSSSASLHGNPYSSHWCQLIDISIAYWLAASMWDFLLFCLLHTTPIIIFYSTHRAMSMAHAHVLRETWKSLRLLKYETIAWLDIGVVHDGSIFVWRRWSITKLYDFVGMSFLSPCYFERT